jgi:tripeptidyl-peptidase-2
MSLSRLLTAALMLAAACAPAQRKPEPAVPKPNIDPVATRRQPAVVPEPEKPPPPPRPADTVVRIAPPEAAYAHGLMSLASTGVDQFLRAHPTYDGRGVLIAILDTGIDPGIPGLSVTSTGDPKVVDLRDFSGEGAVRLTRITPIADSVEIAGRWLRGISRVAALDADGPYYAGVIAEIPLGEPPACDLNGNGAVADTLPVVVTRATDGWVLLADTDGDGSLAGERPVHDYLRGRESVGWAPAGRAPRLSIAANFSEAGDEPRLDLVFDLGAHGSHVAGIAAAHDLYGVPGFDGVAPGAQLLGLKIANSALGSVSTTGAMVEAVDYAVRFAQARRMPLVFNLSFGVGNEIEGGARIDALLDSVLRRHPDVVFTASAGNDGPGLSTIGFPGSASRAITVGATFPATFVPPPRGGGPTVEGVAYFSSRGGELAKPELVTPGMAYSSVPRWNAGDEVKQGTSMAAPHAAGLAAILLSAVAQDSIGRIGKRVEARLIKQALIVTARPTIGAGFIDEGRGLPDIAAALEWLQAGRNVPDVEVRALRTGSTAAWITVPPGSKPTTGTQSFRLTRVASGPPATFDLKSDVPWLSAPARVTLRDSTVRVDVRYSTAKLSPPGGYSGTVSGWTADTLAGPAFRLVVTVVAPASAGATPELLRSAVRVPAGGVLRSFFQADSAPPFAVRVSSGSRAEQALTFLHEPHGMPYRDESARAASTGPQAAAYHADARDVVSGTYEIVAAAPPNQGVSATVSLAQAPFTLQVEPGARGATAVLHNLAEAPVSAALTMQVAGGERGDTVAARGSAMQRIPFVAPAWVSGVVVDVIMDRAQWGRFTDFGVTLFDSLGRQLGKQPLNYAFGRLQVELPKGHGSMPVTLALSPGFADPTGDESWSLRTSIRLYADSAVALGPVSGAPNLLTIRPGGRGRTSFVVPESPWPLSDGFSPLAVLIARTGSQIWTRETALPITRPEAAR